MNSNFNIMYKRMICFNLINEGESKILSSSLLTFIHIAKIKIKKSKKKLKLKLNK